MRNSTQKKTAEMLRFDYKAVNIFFIVIYCKFQDQATSNIRRSTRHSHEVNGLSTRREIKKNSKYLFDYETEEIHSNNRRKSRNDDEDRSEKCDKLTRSRRESSDKEIDNNSNNNRSNGRLKKEREAKTEIQNAEESTSSDTKAKVENADDENNDQNEADKTEEKEENSEIIRPQKNIHNRHPSRRRTNRKLSSSSSSEVGKVYALRERPTKTKTQRTRKQFKRRIKPLK